MNPNEAILKRGRWWVSPAIVGVASFMISHGFLVLTWHEQRGPWFLNSTYGIVATDIIIFLGAAASGLFQAPHLMSKVLAFSCGSLIGMIVALATIGGPGNLGPIVPFLGCIIMAPAILLGVCTGHFLKDAYKKGIRD